MPDPVCPATGLSMVRDTRPMTIRFKGQMATFDMPGWYCDESGESIHTGDDMKVSDRELARLKGTIEGLLPPAEVRRVRKRLGLTQREASAIVGGGRTRAPRKNVWNRRAAPRRRHNCVPVPAVDDVSCAPITGCVPGAAIVALTR